jgi:hypothetical protein
MDIENKTEDNTTYPKHYSDYIMIDLICEKTVFYLLILTISIGIPGNVTSILIFSKIFSKPSRIFIKTNTGFLYTFLCVLNLIAILFNVLVKNSYIFFHYAIQLPQSSNVFIENILLQMLSWFHVIIAFDRFIAVVYPIIGIRIMRKTWVLYSIILGMFVVIIGLNSPYFIRESIHIFKDGMNVTQKNITRPISVYIETIKVSMQVFIPFSIMLILDLLIIINMRKFKSFPLSEGRNTQSNSTDKSWRFTRNTILMDLIYLVFKLPSVVFDFYFIHIFINIFIEKLPPSFLLIFHIFSLLPYIYSSLLFILFIAFNKIFRAQFTTMLNKQRFFIFIKNLF